MMATWIVKRSSLLVSVSVVGEDLEEVVEHLEGLLLVIDVEAEVELEPEQIQVGRDLVAKSALREICENRRWFLELRFLGQILQTILILKIIIVFTIKILYVFLFTFML